MACDLSKKPLQSVRPIDKIQMAHTQKSTLISTPFTTSDADESIIRTFYLLKEPMRETEDGPQTGVHTRSV